MPKRKNEDEYERLLKKFKKLEKKVRRRCRSKSRSSSTSRTSHKRYRSESREQEIISDSESREIAESNVARLLDGSAAATLEPERCAEPAREPTPCSARTPVAATMPAAAAETATAATAAAEPSTSAILTENLPHVTSCENLESADATLDSTILEILGEDPTVTNNYGAEIHKDLAVRLEHIATNGLLKELRKELNEKYLLPSNCKLIDGPTLNAEIKAAISDITAKRDKSIELRQKQVATAIACLSQVLNKLFSKDADPEIIRMLMDTERILCDSQYNDSTIRRNFILSSLKKDMKDQLQNTKPDNLLFGQNLSEALKAAKAINKSGAELKVPAPKPQVTNKKLPATNTSKNLNWKGPYPSRKPPNHPKRKEPPPSKSRQSSSSRHSQHPQTRGRR